MNWPVRPDAADAPASGRRAGALPPRRLAVLLIVVLGNYAAQIPYALDLYGTHFSLPGAALLGATLAWFLAGVALCQRGRPAGYWLLLSFLATEFVFYFHGQVLGMARGYGMVYILIHAHDAIVRAVFIAGDVNFIAAGYFAAYLVWRRRRPASGF